MTTSARRAVSSERGHRQRILIGAALACWLKAVSLSAQGVTGAAIQGRVTGPDSTATEAATVLVTNASNGER